MEWLQNLLSNYSQWVVLAIYLVLEIIAKICSMISGNIKNAKYKKVLNLLPDALEYAETNGTSAENKLALCIEYIQGVIKGFSSKELTTFINNYIDMTKNVNATANVDKIKSRLNK